MNLDALPFPVIKCDLVDVHFVYHEQEIASYTMPAYTRAPADLSHILDEYRTDYLAASAAEGSGVSLGDFVMYLAVKASQEPKEIVSE